MNPYMVVLPNGYSVPSYPFVYAASAVVFVACALWLCRWSCVRARVALDLGVLYLAAMTVFAGLAYDAVNREATLRSLTVGGLLEGGLVGGAFILLGLLFLYTWGARLGPRALDIGSVALPAGLAVAKVACLLQGCCYGAEYTGVLAVVFPEGSAAPAGTPVHPTQLYDLAWFLTIYVALLAFMLSGRTRAGWSPVWFLLLFCAGRFCTDRFRGDGTGEPLVGGLTRTQAAYALGLAVAAVFAVGPERWWESVLDRVRRRAAAETPWLAPAPGGRRLRAALLDIVGAAALAITCAETFGAWELGVWLYAGLGHAVSTVLFGGTLGMVISGATVMRDDGRPARLEALVRAIAWVVSGLSLPAALSGRLGGRGRCFCDVVSGTVVVPRERAVVKRGACGPG